MGSVGIAITLTTLSDVLCFLFGALYCPSIVILITSIHYFHSITSTFTSTSGTSSNLPVHTHSAVLRLFVPGLVSSLCFA